MDWQEYLRDIPLLVLFDLAEAPTIGARARYGFGLEKLFFYYERGALHWFYDLSELRDCGSKIMVDEKLSNRFFEESLALAGKLDSESKKLFSRKPSELSNAELASALTSFLKSWRRFWDSAMAIDWLEITLSESINARLAKRFDSARAARLYAALTIPEKESLPAQEEKSLLAIVARIQGDADARTREKLEAADFIAFANDFPDFARDFERHSRKFFWVHAPWFPWSVLSTKDFFSRAAELSREANAALEKLKREEKRVAALELKKRAVEEVRADSELIRLVELNNRLSCFHEVKNTVKTIPWFRVKPFVDEAGNRMRLGENVYWLLPNEVTLALQGKDYSALARERARFCLFEFDSRTTKFKESLGEKGRTELKRLQCAVASDEHWSEIRGVSASPGRAKGKARVVRDATQIREVRQGEVLVAVMTTPDFTPALKRVAAIVTDEGGVTCHAAVVSRELGVPCVIATRNASKRIKTGELIEVDATNGLVKRIR